MKDNLFVFLSVYSVYSVLSVVFMFVCLTAEATENTELNNFLSASSADNYTPELPLN